MLYVYAPTIYPGTRELITALGAKRLVKHDGMRFLHKGTPIEFAPTDRIVCWGSHVPVVSNVPCLNASYKYPTLLSINTQGLTDIGRFGVTAFPAILVGKEIYSSTIEQVRAGKEWPKTAARGYVAIEEFEDYGTQHYKFPVVSKVTVFCGVALVDGPPAVQEGAVKALRTLNLDFGSVMVGLTANNAPVILKVITAPKLDDKGVELFAKNIMRWARE